MAEEKEKVSSKKKSSGGISKKKIIFILAGILSIIGLCALSAYTSYSIMKTRHKIEREEAELTEHGRIGAHYKFPSQFEAVTLDSGMVKFEMELALRHSNHFKIVSTVSARLQNLILSYVAQHTTDGLRDKFRNKLEEYDDELAYQLNIEMAHLLNRGIRREVERVENLPELSEDPVVEVYIYTFSTFKF